MLDPSCAKDLPYSSLEEPLSLCALAQRADVPGNLLSSVLRPKTNFEDVLASIRKLPKPGVMECRIEEIDWQMTKLYWDKFPLHPNLVNVADTGFLRLIGCSSKLLTLSRREGKC